MNEAMIFEGMRQLILLYFTLAQMAGKTPEEAKAMWEVSWAEVQQNPPETMKDI